MVNIETLIITGGIHTGKTTFLSQYVRTSNNAAGILSPVINGDRFFVNIATHEVFSMEANENETALIFIGKFRFSPVAFKRGIALLEKAIAENKKIIILDEIGPLELRGEGFSNVIFELVAKKSIRKIFIVRESLLENVIDHFKIQNCKVITPQNPTILLEFLALSNT